MIITIETGDVLKVRVGDGQAHSFDVDRCVVTAYGNRAIVDLPGNRRVVIFDDRCAVTEFGETVSESGGWKPSRPGQLPPGRSREDYDCTGRLTARKDPPLIDPDKELAAVDIAKRNGWLSAGDAERERSRIRQFEILSHLTIQK